MTAGRTRTRSRLLDGWPYILVAFLYVATSPYHHGLNNPNEMIRVYMSRAWCDSGTFDIGPVIDAWGPVDDKAIRHGTLLSSKAPLQSLVGIFAYAAAEPLLRWFGLPTDKRNITHVMRLFGSTLFGFGFAAWLIAWARRRTVELGAPRTLGTALGLAGALGTMLYPYSLTFTGHLLAAVTAGGTVLLALAATRLRPGSGAWRLTAVTMGFAAGAAPFAEYPAALVAAPMLAAVFWATRGALRRAELTGLLAAGGSLPFGVGLWVHATLWGSPFATGYSFLENPSYAQAHHEGFFGVTYPKADALAGSLFSPGTGLFFFSPILILGVLGLARCALGQRREATGALPRALAIAGLVALLSSLFFIGAHHGWRGGWTIGPRYIIAVAPLLLVWAIEAQASVRLRPWTSALGGASIVLTGFAAALYPHLSDVFTNPLATFLWPSYARGEYAYGVGHALGLRGHAANLAHVLPLTAAALWVGLGTAPRRWTAVTALGVTFLVAGIPERNPVAARRENRRLWGFWEPVNPNKTDVAPRGQPRPGRLLRARSRWREVDIEIEDARGARRPCRTERGRACRYGDAPWQRFQPDILQIDGAREPVLFLHPVAGATVRARLPIHPRAKRAVLWYGLSDAAVTSENTAPVELAVVQRGRTLARATASNTFGFQMIELVLTSTHPVTLELRVERDGARVFGFDWDLFDH